jgi:DNA polymerase-3 subunit epsilon
LLDSELLAEVYVELVGGRQSALVLASDIRIVEQTTIISIAPRAEPMAPLIAIEEESAHRAFIGKMGDKALWLKYLPQ